MSERAKGSTSVSLLFRLTDSVTGAAKSGIDVTTLKLQYVRPGAAASSATSLTALFTQTASFTAFGAKESDGTNSKGIYRVDCPDAAFATGADEVTLSVSGTGIETSSRLIDLTGADMRNATTLGLSAVPATLIATGLDAIPITAPAGVAGTFREMVVQTWRRFFKKATRTTTQVKVYADDGTTVVATQTISDDGAGNETQGAAS